MSARTWADSATCTTCLQRPRIRPNERPDAVLHRYVIGWANRHANNHPGHRVVVHLWRYYLARATR